jgi:thymidylate synthase
LVWTGGDVHIYSNHIDQVREQLSREPKPFPTLTLARHGGGINDFKIGDFQVNGYEPHPPIFGDVAV